MLSTKMKGFMFSGSSHAVFSFASLLCGVNSYKKEFAPLGFPVKVDTISEGLCPS